MKLWREIKQEFLDALQSSLGEREAMAQFKLLLEFYTGVYQPSLTDLGKPITAVEYEKIKKQIVRLQNGEPIQYILGYAWFDDLKLSVNKHVLIPRQETEELVYWIIEDLNIEQPYSVIDIGTGSGAIALALANHFQGASVIGVDVSEEALRVAESNRGQLCFKNCRFKKLDILDQPKLNQTFDLIVSNPPYITNNYAEKMEEGVTAHEPHLALFVPDEDPLLFYREITNFAKSHLKLEGKLYFEINEFFIDELLELLQHNGFEAEAKRDLNGNWRMVRAMRNAYID